MNFGWNARSYIITLRILRTTAKSYSIVVFIIFASGQGFDSLIRLVSVRLYRA